MISLASRCWLVGAIVCALVATTAQAQFTWTGLAAPDNQWTTAGNWDSGVPGSGASVVFNGPGNGNTNISLGGTTQTVNTLLFDTPSAAAYTLGQQPGDVLSFDTGGILAVDTAVTTPQAINATLQVNGGLLVTNSVSNGGPMVGNGLIGLTLGPVNLVDGTLFVSNGQATTTTALNGNITDSPGQPGSLSLLSSSGGGAANINSNFIINGNNTYTGGTTIQANTGTNGSIQIGTDMPFGSGKVTNIFQGNSVEFRALNGTRTIANAIDLDGGINFAGENSFVLNGPIFIKGGVSRTLSNKISSGSTLTLGASPGSSTIYLGNPVSNGGDGAGRTIILSATAGTTMYVNALFQDVDPIGADSAVRYGGNAGGNIIINTPQTYTSRTLLGGGSSTVQFKHDYNVGDPSGPFGLGTLIADNAANNHLAPIGGDRTIANPIQMNTGFTVNNVAGDTSSVTFTGPITFTSTSSRLIQNLMPAGGGTLTLGSSSSPSTLTLASTAGLTLTFAGSGKTVINDTIQDSPGVPMNLAVSNTSTTTFNGPQNTEGNFSVTGNNSTVIINGNRSGSGSISLTGSNTRLLVNGSKTGNGTVMINGTGTLGGIGSIAGDVTNNGTIAPGSVAPSASIGTLTLADNVTLGEDSRLAIELSGTLADRLAVGGNLDLSSLDSLDATGAGSGSSWIIATYGGTLTGGFDNVTPGFTVDYGTGSNSQITLMAAGLAGDWNHDGIVDAADYVAWRKDPANHGGDPEGYNIWRQNFGNVTGGSAALNAGSAVPEPSTVLHFVLAYAVLPTCRRRRML